MAFNASFYWVMSDFSSHRFFAGGSERSGQQIVALPKKKSSNELVEDLFKGAKEHGAVPVDKPGKGPGESSKSSKVDYPLNKLYCKWKIICLLIVYSYLIWFWVTPFSFCLLILKPFGGGGYRLGAAPEEESTYVTGERRKSSSAQDVSH